MPDFLRVVGWEKFQHYHDRCPPWIKLYNSILSDPEYCRLRDASKAHLFGIWLLASQRNNKILADPAYIGQQIGATTRVDLSPLVSAGFIELYQDASKMLATCKQDARPEKSREEERREDSSSPEVTVDVDNFTRFWTAYPRKVGKAAARKSWSKLKPPIEAVLSALKWQVRSEQWTKDGGQFIPHPATYLNQGRWEDGQTNKSSSGNSTQFAVVDELRREREAILAERRRNTGETAAIVTPSDSQLG